MKVTAEYLPIGAVCIVVAYLLLVWLRSAGDLPLPEWLEVSIAIALGAIAWMVVARLRRPAKLLLSDD